MINHELSNGLYKDGWLQRAATLVVDNKKKNFRLELWNPEVSNVFKNNTVVIYNNGVVQTYLVKSGELVSIDIKSESDNEEIYVISEQFSMLNDNHRLIGLKLHSVSFLKSK